MPKLEINLPNQLHRPAAKTRGMARHQRQRPKGSGLIVHFICDDEALYWAARVAATRRKIPFYRYVMQAMEVLVRYDAQSDPSVKAAIEEKKTKSSNGSIGGRDVGRG